MIGDNYPEKGPPENDLELTLRGCNAVAFVPRFDCLPPPPKEGKTGSVSGRAGGPKPGEAGFLWEAGDRRIIRFTLVCSDYLLGLPSVSSL